MKRDFYGFLLDGEQGMKLSKFIQNNGIAMNTLTKEERKNIVENFINENKWQLKITD